eukprot:TRINITY_DN7663_c0_g2_i1.p1 TRINITY_DN7663_c0_g2~~TRINITY_DN7663_c0_g2_i1.p1  ORF type:complete len:220 (+),score=-16.58 TRINITY_DN7663_c0_g2_i1:449-1108(+)
MDLEIQNVNWWFSLEKFNYSKFTLPKQNQQNKIQQKNTTDVQSCFFQSYEKASHISMIHYMNILVLINATCVQQQNVQNFTHSICKLINTTTSQDCVLFIHQGKLHLQTTQNKQRTQPFTSQSKNLNQQQLNSTRPVRKYRYNGRIVSKNEKLFCIVYRFVSEHTRIIQYNIEPHRKHQKIVTNIYTIKQYQGISYVWDTSYRRGESRKLSVGLIFTHL